MAAMEKTSTPGIYRKGNRYIVVWRHRGQQHKSSHRTFAEAREAKGRRAAGDRRPAARVKFEGFARQWLDGYQGRTQRGFSETTRIEYRRALEQHAIPYFRRCRLDEVEPQDVRRFFAQLERKGLTAAGVRKVRVPLSAMYADAIEDGLVRHNPARVRIKRTTWPGEEVEAKPKALTRKELGVLLGALPEQWRPFFEFLAHTGLRISEAIALTWADVEFGKRPVIHVRTQVYRGERKRLKSEHSRRTIPLSPGMARALWQAHGAAQDRSEGAPVFPTSTGSVLSSSNLRNRVLVPAAKAAGLEWVGFHAFRHTCASLLFEAGRNPKQVQAWLGHHDPGFTLATYVHLMDEGVGDAAFLDSAITLEVDTPPVTVQADSVSSSVGS